jgi:phosphatidylcholine synthase
MHARGSIPGFARVIPSTSPRCRSGRRVLPEENAPSAAPAGERIAAWLVHGLTASGAVFAFLALLAIQQQDWPLALLWLAAALAVDAFDGTFARWARVKTNAPRIDGDTLDLIVDYLNYVFVPTVLIWRAGLVPERLTPWLAAAILISALYNFARRDLKTEDNYFRGFPALWNVVAFYLFVSRAEPAVAAIAVAVLAALTFTSVRVVHPFRVREYGFWLPLIALIWAAATLALLWPGWTATLRSAWLGLSLATLAILIGMGFLSSFRRRGARGQEKSG